MEHCISTLREKNREKTLRVYVTDSLMYISEILAKRYSGSYMSRRYIDLIEPKKEDERTPEDIISRLKDKMRKL